METTSGYRSSKIPVSLVTGSVEPGRCYCRFVDRKCGRNDEGSTWQMMYENIMSVGAKIMSASGNKLYLIKMQMQLSSGELPATDRPGWLCSNEWYSR